VQQSLIRAVKTLSKDVVIDLLLHDARERADAEAAAAAARGDEDAGEEGAARDEALQEETAGAAASGEAGPAEAEWGSGKRPSAATHKETAAAEYSRRRAEMRQRPFADLCSSITADDIPQVRL
jgi:hypothetical protein